MKIHPAINILTGILAVILCIVLVVSSLCTVIAGSVAASLSVDSITKIIGSIDYSELFSFEESESDNSDDIENNDDSLTGVEIGESDSALDSTVEGDEAISETESSPVVVPEESTDEILEVFELSPEAMDAIMKSEFMHSIIDSVSEGIVAGLTGDDTYEAISESEIKKIFSDNMDEIVDITKESLGADIDEAELRDNLTKFIDETAGDVSSIINETANITSVVDESTVEAISFIMSGKLTASLALVSLGLLIIISLIRFWYFSGVFFSGVAIAISAVISGLVALTLGKLPSVIFTEPDSTLALIVPMVRTLTYNTAIGAGILALIAAALIAGSVLLKKRIMNKKSSALSSSEASEESVSVEV